MELRDEQVALTKEPQTFIPVGFQEVDINLGQRSKYDTARIIYAQGRIHVYVSDARPFLSIFAFFFYLAPVPCKFQSKYIIR